MNITLEGLRGILQLGFLLTVGYTHWPSGGAAGRTRAVAALSPDTPIPLLQELVIEYFFFP
jgi:hypothetical protein